MKLCIVTDPKSLANIRKYVELFQEVIVIGSFCLIQTKSTINSFILDEAVFSKYCHKGWVYFYMKVPFVPRHEFYY